MPLTKLGEKIKHNMFKEYGKSYGQRVFYAFENKHPELQLIKIKGGKK